MCSGCNQIISPTELVMKALQYVYHIDCFKCHECGDKLEKGDEFLLKDDKLYCSSDFNVAEQRSDSKISLLHVRFLFIYFFFWKKRFLKISQNSWESNTTKVSGCNFIEKGRPTQMFFCEFSEIFKNTYSEEHLRTVTSKTIQKFTKKNRH